MSGENSCFSRFLVKFVEVSAAGLATAISAYALAHLGGTPVILSHANFRAGDRCSGQSNRQRGRRARQTDSACCGRCGQQPEPCAAAGHGCDRRAARA